MEHGKYNPNSLPPNSLKLIPYYPSISHKDIHPGMALTAVNGSEINMEHLEAFDWSGNSPETAISSRGYNTRIKRYPETNGLIMDGVLNQGQCGNCWAMASTSALTDRFIIGKGLSGLHLNPLVLTSCENNAHEHCSTKYGSGNNSQGCEGGFSGCAGEYFEKFGTYKTNDNSCETQTWKKFLDNHTSLKESEFNGKLPTCKNVVNNCDNSGPVFKAIPGSTKMLAVRGQNRDEQITLTVKNVKRSLANGPVVGGFIVFEDFYNFHTGPLHKNNAWKRTNGIYINGAYDDLVPGTPSNKFRGGHAVVIVGWDHDIINIGGRDVDVEYWIVKNSWTSLWGDKGYFKYAITKSSSGFNINCGLEIGASPPGEDYLIGGATIFDADLTTGDAQHKKYKKIHKNVDINTNTGTKTNGKKYLKWALIIIAIILLISIFVYSYMKSR